MISKEGSGYTFEIEKMKYIKAFSIWLSVSKDSLHLESYKNLTLKHLNLFKEVKDQSEFLSSLKDFKLIKESNYIEQKVAEWIYKNPIAFMNRSSLDNLKECPKLRSEILSSYVDEKGIDKTILYYLVLYDFGGKFETLLVKVCIEYLFESDTYDQKDNSFRLFLKLAQKGTPFKLIPKEQIMEIRSSLLKEDLSPQKFSFFLSILYHNSREDFLENYNFLLRKFCDSYRLNKSFQEGIDNLPLNDLLLFKFTKVDQLNSKAKSSLSELALSNHNFKSAKSGLIRIAAMSILGMYDKELYKGLLSKSKIYELFYSNVSGSYIMYPFFLNYGLLKYPEPRIGELDTNSMIKRKSLHTAINLLDNFNDKGHELSLATLASGLQMRTKKSQREIISDLGLNLDFLIQNKSYFLNQIFLLGGQESVKFKYNEISKGFEGKNTNIVRWNAYFDLIFTQNIYPEHQERFIKFINDGDSPDKKLLDYIISLIRGKNIPLTRELILRMVRTENQNILISVIKNQAIKKAITDYTSSNSVPDISLLGFSNLRPVARLHDYSRELSGLYFILAILDQSNIGGEAINPEVNFFRRFGF